MRKISNLILRIGTASFFVSVITLIGGFISKKDGITQGVLSGIAFYGTLITVFILSLHLAIVFISLLIKTVKKHGNDPGD